MSEIFRTPFPQMRGSHIAISEGRTPVGITLEMKSHSTPTDLLLFPQVTGSFSTRANVKNGNAGHIHPLSCAYPAE